ncbi:methyl-accepting chemotaxis protein McpB [Lachnospiraceae bacterium]|nr:methyl-accepting chemotaxis protein McpB [Lachnospiraceae bacterium]
MNHGKSTIRSVVIFQTIKSKILLMGVFSILVAVCIGVLGINSINRNSSNSEIESIVNEIDVLQAKNLGLEAQYQYYIDQKYLDNILDNLGQMTLNAELLQHLTDTKYKEDIDKILEKLTKSSANYSKISELSKTRGFDGESGLYGQYLEGSGILDDSFSGLIDKQDWLEIKWIDAHMWTSGELVEIGGKEYIRLIYSGPIPEKVKRNSLAFRVGGTLTYHNDCYITDIKLVKGTNSIDIDLSLIDKLDGSGLAYVDSEITTFDSKSAIRVGCNFNAANEGWEEFAVAIPVKEYAAQDYANIEYSLYMEPNDLSYDYKYGGSYSGVYSFKDSLDRLDNQVKTYSKLVVEGKDTTDDYAGIEMLMTEMEENIPLYTMSSELINDSLGKLSAKKEIFGQMKKIDDTILELKTENKVLNEELTTLCGIVKDIASDDMVRVKSMVQNASIIVIIIASIILVGLTVLISSSIDRNVMHFRKALDQITQGKIAVRIKANGKDEFSQFGKSLNVFLDKLEDSISQLQGISINLAETGNALESKANRTKGASEVISTALDEIAKGAAVQASDISDSSQQASRMQENMIQITASVENLSETSKSMSERGTEVTKIVQELSHASDRTSDAFVKISDQIHKTNASVVKIQEVVNLIAEIASQTNLLSLNASIEAARAGEAGRGFAVVASEIQKLAEQTNSSAKIIDDIILSLSKESLQTVQSINEVTNIVLSQKKQLDETKEKFGIVEEGIKSTTDNMNTVLEQAVVCGNAGSQVVNLMTNLSAIAEENAATTEQTNTSMNELNDATASLARTAMELKKLSVAVTDNLNYFNIEE